MLKSFFEKNIHEILNREQMKNLSGGDNIMRHPGNHCIGIEGVIPTGCPCGSGSCAQTPNGPGYCNYRGRCA
jgi:hypothetical protein